MASATAVVLFAPSASATSYPPPATHKDGTAVGGRFASSVALMDLNNDGIADLIVGAPYNLSSQGSVTFFLSSGGVPFAKAITVNGWPGSLFGFSVANVGNVSGAGPALAVGAPFASPGGLAQAGNITIFDPSASFSGKAGAWINSTHAGEELGYSLAAAGNINGDLYDDLLAGAPFCGSTANGCAYVFFGGNPPQAAPAMMFTTASTAAHFGWSVAGGASVDGNSALDIVVGAPDASSSTGAVTIIRNLMGTGGSANRTNVVTGTAALDRFGFSVAMGDFNGDTFGDVAMGAPGASGGAGTVSVVYGASRFTGSIGTTLIGAPGESFGWDVAAGNFHRDLFTDLLVGAPASTLNSTGTGRAYAFYGGSSLATSPNLTLVPAAGDVALGWTVAVGGDFNRDGGPDFVVGDPQFTAGGRVDLGRAYVYAGSVVIAPRNPIIQGWICVPGTWKASTRTCGGLSGFTVTLDPSGKTTTSLANGSFTFTDVPGTHIVNTTKFPYIDNSTSLVIAFDNVYQVLVFPRTIPHLYGVAKDAVNRTAFAGVHVALYNATNVVANSTVTPATLNYSVYLPSRYIPAMGSSLSLTVRMWDGMHYTNATSISIARNESLNVSMFLNRFPALGGTVRDYTLLPIAGAAVQATQGSTVIATTTTNNKGVYSLLAVNASVPRDLFLNFTALGHVRLHTAQAVNQNNSYTVDVFLQTDTQAPTSTISPLLPTYTNTAIVTIAATATDNYPNNVAQVQLFYRFNGTGNFILGGTDTSAPYTFAFNTTAASRDGTYEFYTLATDYGGNTQAKPSGNMTWTIVDTRAPSSKVAALTTYETTANFTLTATASDWNRIQSVGLYYRKGTSGTYSLLSSTAVSPYRWYFNVTLLGTGEGLYQFYSIATDAAGNVESPPASPDATTTVDATPPSLTITRPTASQVIGTGYVNVTWTASDTTSGIQKFDVRLDAGPWVHAGTKLWYNFTFVPDGSHTVTVNATDNAGNSAKVSVSFTVSTVSPVVRISSPANNAVLATSSVAVQWTVTNVGAGLASIEVRLDSGTWISAGISATSYTLTSVADGSHTITVRATGLNGAQGSATISIVVDATAPTVTISAPSNNAYSASSSVVVTWSATDAGTGVATVQVSVDGSAWTTVTGTTYTFAGLADGSHTLNVQATDGAGNTATASVTVVVDTVNPTVGITAPTANAWVNSGSVAVTWTDADSTSGVGAITISVDGGTAVDASGLTTYTLTGLADGSHTATVTVTDRAGNKATTSVTFKVDATAPTLQIASPTAGAAVAGPSVSISWTDSDAGSGVAKVEISVDGAAYMDLGVTTSTTVNNLAAGSHSVNVRVTDVAGNKATASVTFTVSGGAGGLDPLVVGSIGVVIVVAAVVAAVLLRRRGGKKPPAPEEPKEPPAEEAKGPEELP